MEKIEVMQDVLSANEYIAQENRKHFKKKGALVINIMSSPGSGKTSLIIETIKRLKDWKIVVIEGDVEGDVDAKKIEETGIPAIQINTSGACHLDARMIHKALQKMNDEKVDLVLIENVGNLICPTSYNLGEDYKVVILSLPEGEDKPLKYPRIFQVADLLVLNKIDMEGPADFNFKNFNKIINKVNPKLEMAPVSCKSGKGMDKWIDWIKGVHAKDQD
ncbi:MAG: hydrogenase nickel incorporation protein HypB [Spirochaetes bacterium]|nr:hydrogenase nickel incorporation protein HypB [Spirochaetota bacterium]